MPFSFRENKVTDRFNFHELPEINQVQFLIAGRNAWGPSKSDLPDIFSAGDTGEQMVWEYYKITETESGLHLYDAWILAGDSGTVFHANTAVPARIEMCQSYIDAVTDHSETAAIAAEIREAYKSAPGAFEDENKGFDKEAFTRYWSEYYKKKEASPDHEMHWKALSAKLESLIPA